MTDRIAGTVATRTLALGLLAAAACVLTAGCSAPPGPYRFSRKYLRQEVESQTPPGFDAQKPRIERGQPVALVDGMGHYFFSLLGKLLLWDTRVGNHRFSKENEDLVYRYLEGNELDRVKVRVNQYAPGGEFMRLAQNSDVNLFWRATFGFGYWIKYTLLPDRLFAGLPLFGDRYDPFTNTVHLYSDHPALAIQRAAHARDAAERRFRGLYGALRVIPGVDIYQESVATSDAQRYFYWWREKEREVAGYKILYPDFMTHCGPWVIAIGPIPALVYGGVAVTGAIVGHASGRDMAATRLAMTDPPIWQDMAAQPAPKAETPAAAR